MLYETILRFLYFILLLFSCLLFFWYYFSCFYKRFVKDVEKRREKEKKRIANENHNIQARKSQHL